MLGILEGEIFVLGGAALFCPFVVAALGKRTLKGHVTFNGRLCCDHGNESEQQNCVGSFSECGMNQNG